MAVNVPIGYVVLDEKWKNTELCSLLRKTVRVQIADSMGIVDFYPSSDIAAVYVSEADLLSGGDYKRKLVKLRKVKCAQHLVVIEKTHVSAQYFDAAQKFSVLELGLGILPVSGQAECARLFTYLVQQSSRENSNPFQVKKRMPPLQVCILNSLSTIPSLGQVKAQALLERFHSLHAIGIAGVEELETVIGHNAAEKVYNFFHAV